MLLRLPCLNASDRASKHAASSTPQGHEAKGLLYSYDGTDFKKQQSPIHGPALSHTVCMLDQLAGRSELHTFKHVQEPDGTRHHTSMPTGTKFLLLRLCAVKPGDLIPPTTYCFCGKHQASE